MLQCICNKSFYIIIVIQFLGGKQLAKFENNQRQAVFSNLIWIVISADADSSADTISYVILNPTPMRKLRLGDIV